MNGQVLYECLLWLVAHQESQRQRESPGIGGEGRNKQFTQVTAETNQQNHHIEEQGCNREIGTSVLKFIIGKHHCLVLVGSKFGREQRDIICVHKPGF